jgi:ABC-type transport system substrate-binding protein
MEHAIDKQTIVDQVLFGITKPTSCVVSWIVGAYSGDYNNAENGYTGPYPIVKREFNPDGARKLLDDAGWVLKDGVRQKDGVKIEGVEMPYYHYATSWAEAISQYWADIGIFIDPVPIESTTFFQGIEVTELGLENEAVGGPYPLSLNTMGGGPDPGDVYDWIESRPAEYGEGWTQGVNNFGFYVNEDVDRLFAEGRLTGEYLERKAIYDELYWRVHEDAGFIMLWNKWKVEAWNNEFAGFGSQRPIAWYGGYFRGTDESSNIEKGVYWRGGSEDPFPETSVMTSVITQVTTQVVPEFMDLRVLAVFALSLLTGVFVYRRRRSEE